VVIAITDTSRP